MTTVARVVLDSPLPQLDRLFDYRVPAELEDDCVAGVRVKVPLRTGARMSDGYVVEIVTEGEYPGELSQIEAVLSPVPVLAPEIWALARAVADRAAGVASDVLRLAVPPRQVRAEKAWLARDTAWSPPPVSAPPVTGYADGVLEAVVTEHGRAAVAAVPQPVAVGDAGEPVWVPGWAATLAQAAAHTVAAEQSAVIAVPDFRDVIDLERALLAVLPPERVVRFDAKQTNGQRAKALLQARTHPVVAIGNRTAVYAPATELGLIAMWDDGDASFIEQRAPYVHTRDVALVRAAQSGAALLFVSHARSTDVQRLVELHWLQDVVPHRVKTPKVIPTVQQTGAEGFAAQARIPSSAWRAAREASQHGAVLVQVASPGFGTGLVCAECGERAHCRVCGGPLGSPHRGATPQCRFCGALAVGFRCPTCGNGTVKPVGQGAQRTADELGRAFPGTRIVVADGSRPLDEVPARPSVVVATRGAEPSVPGGYACVLLLDGEKMLAREGLRVQEDVLRFWTNAAAKSAPGAEVYLVGIGGRLASAMALWRLDGPAHDELTDRRELHFPPAVRVATMTGTDEAVTAAVEALGDAVVGPVLGPVPVEDDALPGTVRAIVRFPYAHGAEVAATLKAEVIRRSSTRRVLKGGNRRRAAPTLRVRLDDAEPFSEV
ncbi:MULTISPECIES: primosomal protein N' [unclassified Curtobacterium]|uniref:primosomal protein N' family DNA-binding protein n=1 Tax=unclassified Curtobacterium TaxID=257496 RepID=UPI000D887329|nr:MULTISPECIES: primosomal protein N' [unclassified Curtobacterium]PYY65260.1 primosomal protein N' [Curtobacterium sp. MCPF17_003]PZE71278.1 primosomal protein N' [Curtobacterium sp. MCPF17_018]WIB72227.1 primosomal protein N' [Curtobacterium sp. MCBD17_026]